MSFRLAPHRPARRPSLTPMIDVVFLLLVFFMLAARFGAETGMALAGAGNGPAYDGPPRLVTVDPDELRLNGVPMSEDALLTGLAALVADPADLVVVQPGTAAPVQALVDALELLQTAGFDRLAVVE